MSKKADKVEAHRIHGELRRLVEVGLLGSEFAKEGEILKAALHIFSGAFGVYSHTHPDSHSVSVAHASLRQADKDSLERWIRVNSEDYCLEWAETRWELELVAKVKSYPKGWAVTILRNRAVWGEVYAARAERRVPNLEQFKRGGSWQPPESEIPEHIAVA